jgi:hypothetical protein
MVQRITITDVPSLDPVAVYLEDCGAGRGKVTITCFNESWSYFWGSIGADSIRVFLVGCSNDYLAGKFSPGLDHTVDDLDKLVEHARKHICKMRRGNDFSKETARELFDLADQHLDDVSEFYDNERDLMYRIFGDEWYEIPKQPNHKYEYLCRILDTVKEALVGTAEKLAA